MAPPTNPRMSRALLSSTEPDIRLEDYLDDKLQLTMDFYDIDILIANVENQRSQLETQLDNAVQELEKARSSSQDRQSTLSDSIADFTALQARIDERFRVLLNSSAPDNALERLQKPMKQLHQVELAYKYVALLQDVETMRLEALSHIPGNPKEAVKPYTRLRKLESRLKRFRDDADGAATHLVEHVGRVVAHLWDDMERMLSQELEDILKKRDWPQGVDSESEMDPEWRECVAKLLDLQVSVEWSSFEGRESSQNVVTLLPYKVMAKPFAQWFRYQFMGDNATSTLQSFGTFCIPQFKALMQKWGVFFRENLFTVQRSRFIDFHMGETSVYLDPACSLVMAMLPVMREKVALVMQEALESPQALSTVMAQLLDLDHMIRSNEYLGRSHEGWTGLADEVLEKHFNAWLQAEKDFALARFHAILDAPDARKIDLQHSGRGKMKPTFGAVRIMDLLKSVTAQYQGVHAFSHKMRFVIDIQIEILDELHTFLKNSVDTYSSSIPGLGAPLRGIATDTMLTSTEFLEDLCKVLCTADYIITTLMDWSSEEFFVSLYNNLQSRAEPAPVDDPFNFVAPTKSIDEDTGFLFDETVAAYTSVRQASEEYLENALITCHDKVFRPYRTEPQWTTLSNDIDVDRATISITPELDEPLKILRRNLDYTSHVLNKATFRRIVRAVIERLQRDLLNTIAFRQTFTELGALQFAHDMDALRAVLNDFLPGSFTTVQQCAKLLSLPNKGEKSMAVVKEIITDGDDADAQDVLDSLDLTLLELGAARQIVQGRVDRFH